MSTQAIIFAGVAIYMVVMIAVGIYASSKTHTVTEFIVAGRGLPVWLCSTTIVATWFGGGTMIGVSGAAYDDGMLGVIADPIGAALCIFLVGFLFARLFRRMRLLTTADFMQQRYGPVAAVAITVSALFSNIAWVGAMLVAFGLIFESLTGTPMIVGIVGGAVVIFIYTAVGGLWAVALTDFVQMIILVVGLVMLLVVVIVDAGGVAAIAAQIPEDRFHLLPQNASNEDWLNYLRAWAIIGLADMASQPLIQRVLAARSERVAQNSFYLGSLGYLVFGMIPVALGIIASVSMPGLDDGEAVIPTLALEHLHPVAIAIFVGALLAAIMSSADSALLACASLLARNMLPLVRPGADDRLGLIVARVSIPVCGAVAIVVAVYFQVVFDLMLDANILGLAAIIVPFVLGVWWRKANRAGALSAMAVGLSTWIVTLNVAPGLPADFLGLGASLLTMLVVTPLTQRIDPPRPIVDCDGNPVDTSNRLGTLPLFGRRR